MFFDARGQSVDSACEVTGNVDTTDPKLKHKTRPKLYNCVIFYCMETIFFFLICGVVFVDLSLKTLHSWDFSLFLWACVSYSCAIVSHYFRKNSTP